MFSEECPPSQQNPCGYKCQNLCHAWRAATYECIHGQDDTCCFTCGEEVSQCPAGLVLRDETTCISPKDCPCILQNGNILAVSFIHFLHELVKLRFLSLLPNSPFINAYFRVF